MLFRRPILATIVLSLLCVVLATAAASWAYQTYGRYSPGLTYQVVVTIIISSVLAPSFLYPIIILAARLRAATGKLQIQATTDSLTGLPNVFALSDHLSDALHEVIDGQMLAVHFIDLDHFKEVNDTLGHAAGDALLLSASKRLKTISQDKLVIARFGGDEFVVIQKNVHSDSEASALAGRIIETLSRQFEIEGHEIHVGATVGTALAPKHGSVATELLRAADMALYRAKLAQRGSWVLFEPTMDAEAQRRRGLENDLRLALEAKQFELVFQPLFEPRTLRITTCEALLRWHHPNLGDIPPEVFIPAAERIGNILEISRWVLRQACAACRQWPTSVRVAVNLSPVHFTHGNVVADVVDALARSDLPASRLELEITETVLLQDISEVRSALDRLHELGVRISLDDFGVGYSGLNYLRRFRLDKVKIDQRFVREITEKERSLTLLKGVVRLCSELGMAVAVEGIETDEQAQIVALEAHVSEVQGFLFCPPISARAISDIVTATAPAGLLPFSDTRREARRRDH